MCKLSIILPVYNVASYLRHSLECLINQSFKDIEIICVDDGSSDDSVNIIKSFVEKDQRVKLLINEHSYAGGARNAGLEISQGDYVMFLDPDDYYDVTMCEDLYNKIVNDNSDILICGVYEVLENCIKYTPPSYMAKINSLFDNKIFTIDDIGDDIWFFLVYPYNKIYKKKFLIENNIKFQLIKNTNDASFAFESLIAASKISLLNKAYYYYRAFRPNNTRLKKSESLDCVVQAYEYAYEKCRNYPKFFKVESGFQTVIIASLIWHLHNYCSIYDEKYESFYNYIKKRLEKDFLYNSNLKLKLKEFNFYDFCLANVILKNDYKNFLKKINQKCFLNVCLTDSKYIIKFLFMSLYSHYYSRDKEKYSILGIPVYKKKVCADKMSKYILGIKISEK